MSEKQSGVLITAPQFGTGKETVGYFTGYACGYLDQDIYYQRRQQQRKLQQRRSQ